MPTRSTSRSKINKYALYEQAVQSPESHAEMFASIYRQVRGHYARRLREDFCGTYRLSAAWVQRNRANQALGIDMDPEPLLYGRRARARELTVDQRRRLKALRGDVLDAPATRHDLVVACNFSFYIFKQRRELIRYFRAARRGLGAEGLFLLEMAGGPGMIEATRERRTLTHRPDRKFTYVWHQKSFDPITRDAEYAIHFKFPDGRALTNAFTYDWRIWTIPEVRDALADAGFSRSIVYWETSHRGQGTGEYAPARRGDNAYSWIAYVVGVR